MTRNDTDHSFNKTILLSNDHVKPIRLTPEGTSLILNVKRQCAANKTLEFTLSYPMTDWDAEITAGAPKAIDINETDVFIRHNCRFSPLLH